MRFVKIDCMELTSFMRTELKTLAFCLALTAAVPQVATAATENGSNAPFDFSYRVAGASALRPTIVFNDNRDTYIELDADVTISVPGGAYSFRQGPYYVVRGIPAEIVLRGKREQVAITYEPHVPTVPVQVAPAISASAAQPLAIGSSTTPAIEKAAETATPRAQKQSPVTEAAPVETPAPACAPKAIQSESSVLVAFAAGNARLSSETEATLLREARARNGLLKEVHVRMPETIGTSALGRKRQDYLADLLVSTGIPRSFVSNQYGAAYGGDSEIVFVNGTDKPCAKRPPVVRMQDGLLTVISHDADIATLLNEIGEKMGIAVRVEGEAKEISVGVAVAAERPSNALARVGAAIGDKATIVLRDNELVLRFN
ncbi:TrbG/VirB9 family P-type conjugative transfer protein [Aromatoleum evansii]|uniref:TrbG/VirB9 family P-type conjugative transfer protein n=1 Tax=Aromatoleum evansii TaxID=59406 RepID=UPI00145FBC73|nr:TrbG/VirB9 family P-type conjugative transfer protein [Aromatoleum evansii]NMG28359.1 DotD/TraH family lipoprotein [Aromatoleum evansii]